MAEIVDGSLHVSEEKIMIVHEELECLIAELLNKKLLTERQAEIINFVVKGKTNKDMAEEFGLVERTIEYHRNRTYPKFNVSNAANLIVKLVAERFVEI